MAELTGWTRTFVLGLGALGGVLVTAYLIHLWKGGAGLGARARAAGL